MEITTLTIILAALLAVSEALALIPALNDNSIFQLFFSIVKRVAGR